MRQTTGTCKSPSGSIVKNIKRAKRKHYSSEEKNRIVLAGLRGEDSIAELCHREGISQGIYYKWSKDFMEAGKRRLAREMPNGCLQLTSVALMVNIGERLFITVPPVRFREAAAHRSDQLANGRNGAGRFDLH
jgi:transposase-like protein